MTSTNFMQPYTVKRIGLAWAAAFVLEMGRRGMEPANGPGDIVFLPLLSALISFPVMFAVLLLGLIFFVPPLNRAWYLHRWVHWMLISIGFASYLFGVSSARHSYFTLHTAPSIANEYLVNWALPGGLCVVFALCFTPLGRRPFTVELPPQPAGPPEREENNLDRYLRRKDAERREQQ